MERIGYFNKAIRVGGFSSTMCIVHKSFSGFRAILPSLFWGGNLIGLCSAIPYDTIHSTLSVINKKKYNAKK